MHQSLQFSVLQRQLLHHWKERGTLARCYKSSFATPSSSHSKASTRGMNTSFNLPSSPLPPWRWLHQAGLSQNSLSTISIKAENNTWQRSSNASSVLAFWGGRGQISAPQTKQWHIRSTSNSAFFFKWWGSRQANVRLNIFNIYNE